MSVNANINNLQPLRLPPLLAGIGLWLGSLINLLTLVCLAGLAWAATHETPGKGDAVIFLSGIFVLMPVTPFVVLFAIPALVQRPTNPMAKVVAVLAFAPWVLVLVAFLIGLCLRTYTSH